MENKFVRELRSVDLLDLEGFIMVMIWFGLVYLFSLLSNFWVGLLLKLGIIIVKFF